ncbi:MAG: hypothetical protein AAF384_13350 [Pseudomonadota bacterium]
MIRTTLFVAALFSSIDVWSASVSDGSLGALTIASSTSLTVPSGGYFNFSSIDIAAGAALDFDLNGFGGTVTLAANDFVNINGNLEQPSLPLTIRSDTAINIGAGGLLAASDLTLDAPIISIDGSVLSTTNLFITGSGLVEIGSSGTLTIATIPPGGGAIDPALFPPHGTPGTGTITLNPYHTDIFPIGGGASNGGGNVSISIIDGGGSGGTVTTAITLNTPVAGGGITTSAGHHDGGGISVIENFPPGGIGPLNPSAGGDGTIFITTIPEVPAVPLPPSWLLLAPALLVLRNHA